MVEKNKVGCGCGCGKGIYMDSKGYLNSVLKPKKEYKKPKKKEKQIFIIKDNKNKKKNIK
tara:strand:+ start:6088 stop:6267 length:180 start_codon:yes stop_codon:yes gene_type:complete